MAQIKLLSPDQVNELSDAMVTAGIAYELKGDWRSVFKRQSYKYKVGYANRVYSMLATIHNSKIDPMINAIVKVTL
jgi:hypothetical protein